MLYFSFLKGKENAKMTTSARRGEALIFAIERNVNRKSVKYNREGGWGRNLQIDRGDSEGVIQKSLGLSYKGRRPSHKVIDRE